MSEEVFKRSLILIGGYIGLLLGGVDNLLQALILFMIIDYITGIMIGIKNNKLSSKVGLSGINKKMLILVMVIIGNIIDVFVLDNGSTCRTVIIFFYLSNEGLSILENVSKLGVPIPNKIKSVLEQLSDDKGDVTNEDFNK